MATWAREQHEKNKPLLFGQLLNQEQFKEYCTDYRGTLVFILQVVEKYLKYP
jgi:hypothetical protein